MAVYAILLNPGHNRVYFDAARRLSLAEFGFAAQELSTPCLDAAVRDIADIPYLVFTAKAPLTPADFRVLSRLSFAYAVFALDSDSPNSALRPVALNIDPFVPQKISTLLKYTGKTNEQFTRLLINVAAAASAFPPLSHLKLLDPLAGKGTTLFEGLALGYDTWGIEQSKKYTAETCTFLKKFLETERLKHTVSTETLHAGNQTAHKTYFSVAKDKAAQKEGLTREIAVIAGDARAAQAFAKKTRFHLIVADLPYGVQHGSTAAKGKAAPSRNPKSLLEGCLPGWHRVLLPGGAMALAFNTFVLKKRDLSELIAASGFDIITPSPETAFLHRVDQAINRDIIIAKKPK